MKSVARIALVNLALLVIGVAAVELAFGSWIFGPDYGLLNIPRNERRVFDVSEFNPGATLVVYTRDAYGFRSDGSLRPEHIDVVVLGGSTTNERFVSDSDTWVARLQRNFRSAGKPVVFANASIDGQTSIGHSVAIDQWLVKIPGLRPRYALIYIGINDAVLSGDDIRQFDAMASPQRTRRFRQYVMNHSALYNLFRTIRGSWRAHEANLMHGRRIHETAHWVAVSHSEDMDALRHEMSGELTSYGQRLATLTTKLRDLGAMPLFITQRSGDYKLVDGSLHKLVSRDTPIERVSDRSMQRLRLFNEVTLATCATLSLTCVDLATKIELVDEDFYDAIHTTPSGSAKIAEFLYTELKDVLKPRLF